MAKRERDHTLRLDSLGRPNVTEARHKRDKCATHSLRLAREEIQHIGYGGYRSNYYALISDPCVRTVDAFLNYARAHPGCLLTLPPADSRAMYRAVATAAPESEAAVVDRLRALRGF